MSIKTVETIEKMRKTRENLSGKIGFVPTMGYLHEGHLSLVKLAQKECDHVIVSIFVNPKQFLPNEDLNKYPRNIKKDLELLKKVNTDIVFLPKTEEFYSNDFETYISLEKLPLKLEGKSRPGHFTGVATVVSKFFNIIQPTHAYFGQKDAQQVLVMKKMIEDLNFPIKIVVGETIRESDGLAMSSRNVFLDKKERQEAAVIYKSLSLAEKLFKSGEKDTEKIVKEIEKLINKTSGKIDYISISDLKTLEELERIEKQALVSIAVKFGKTRLIDNILLNK